MQTQTIYHSPLGDLRLTADTNALLEARFDVSLTMPQEESPVLAETIRWLERYFQGTNPGDLPPIAPKGTPFQQRIWRLTQNIPYGFTASYSMLAKQAAIEMGKAKMSAQAVGGAVRRNPIAILIPCHRVVGANGDLTGYFGGMERKIRLLTLEGLDMTQFTLPTQ
ncbi:MAG: methylated-DNA--[protein]-cysteine S-methyltransferase [Ruminococcus sp.]